MSAVLAVVDISFALHTLCVGIKSRIDAAKALPQTANRCSRLVDQIDGMIDGCNVEDKRTRVILDNIKKAMEELDALLVKINKKIGDVEANSSGCCVCLRLASKGKDALAAEDELERTESELRAHVDALVNASLIHKHASRTSNKLSQADARRFWDEYFGEEREVSVENLAEALRHECEVAGAGVDAETCAAVCRHCFGAGGGSVTVLSFGDVFNLASIQDTMKSLAKRAKAAQRLFTIQVYDYATKRPDENVDAGFMMCRATDSLKVLRALVCGHALSLGDEESTDDDEFEFEGDEIDEGATRSDAAPPAARAKGKKPAVTADQLEAIPPEFHFLARGEFTFFLDECKTRVLRKQEKDLAGAEYLDRVVLVRDADLPESMRPVKKAKSGRRSTNASADAPGSDAGDTAFETHSQGTAPSERDEEDTNVNADDVAEFIMRKSAEAAMEAQCTDVVTAIRVPAVLQGLRAAALKAGVPEEAVTFVVEIDQLRAAAEAIAPTSAGALSMPRLRLVKASASNVIERFMSPSSRFELPIKSDVRKETYDTVAKVAAEAEAEDPKPGLDQAMLEAFVVPFNDVVAALAPALAILRSKSERVNKVVKATNGKQHKVVVLGGGFAGSLVSYNLDNDPEKRFHVTLVDPKHYFEDVTAQPMLLCDPGADAADADGRFKKSTVPYGKVLKHGKHVTGLVASVSTTHVEVGPERFVLPFDSLVIATGSSYSSDIKVVNPSAEYRYRQLSAERAVMAQCDVVLVIGGGLVGVEIAGNVAETIMAGKEGKKVILIQAGPYLLPRVKNAHDKVLAYLTSLGVDVRLNERVVDFDDMSRLYTTNKGNVIVAGKVYRCTGAKPNTDFLKDPNTHASISNAVNDRGFVNVDKHCRLVGCDNVYAGGDILCDEMFSRTGEHVVTGERLPERIGIAAELHALIISNNIKRTLEGETRLAGCDPSKDVFGQYCMISLGKTKGLVVMNGELDKIFEGMGFASGADNAELMRDGCGLSAATPGFKDLVTGLITAGLTTDEGHAGLSGFSEGNGMYDDPLKVAPDAGGGNGDAPAP